MAGLTDDADMVDDFESRMRREYADDPVTLAEILAIESGESQGDVIVVDDEGKRIPPADDAENG